MHQSEAARKWIRKRFIINGTHTGTLQDVQDSHMFRNLRIELGMLAKIGGTIMRQNVVKWIVVAGYVIGLIWAFVPDEYGYSELNYTQYLLAGGDSALGLFNLTAFAARMGFLALVIWRPKRWVFVAGASWASFVILSNVVRGSAPDIVNYAQLLLRTAGFLACLPPARCEHESEPSQQQDRRSVLQ
jgi:hypothetical protein